MPRNFLRIAPSAPNSGGNQIPRALPQADYERRAFGDAVERAVVARDDVEEVIARWTGIPVTSLKEEETRKLLRIESELHTRVISQRPAISALARAIRRSRAGLKNPMRPVGSFLFLGPTGVGKTELTKALAEFLSDHSHSFCSAASAP